MTKYVYGGACGNTLLRTEKCEPVCGEAFCDRCGDCLYCYGDDECFVGPAHWWVEYENT